MTRQMLLKNNWELDKRIIFDRRLKTQYKLHFFKIHTMKHFPKTILLSFVLMIGMAVNMQAQKFGYINSQELIQNIPEVKEANSNIETYTAQLQKKGQEMLQSLQTKYEALEKKRAQGELSPKQIEVEAQQLQQEEMTIAKFEQESQQNIRNKSETLLSPIRERIQKAIDDVAAENGYTYIFDYSMGIILYADQSSDVSAMVKAKLGM